MIKAVSFKMEAAFFYIPFMSSINIKLWRNFYYLYLWFLHPYYKAQKIEISAAYGTPSISVGLAARFTIL